MLEARIVHADLTTIPDKIWNMKNIRQLDLSHNHLHQINPDSLRTLDSLTFLQISDNPFDSIYVQQLREEFPDIEIVF